MVHPVTFRARMTELKRASCTGPTNPLRARAGYNGPNMLSWPAVEASYDKETGMALNSGCAQRSTCSTARWMATAAADRRAQGLRREAAAGRLMRDFCHRVDAE